MWSCGVILYVLLSGMPPFVGKDDKEILAKVRKGVYRLDFEVFKSVSSAGKKYIAKLMEVNPDKRLTAVQAYQDPWIKDTFGGKEAEVPLETLNNLKSITVSPIYLSVQEQDTGGHLPLHHQPDGDQGGEEGTNRCIQGPGF